MHRRRTQRLILFFMLGCGCVNAGAAWTLMQNGRPFGALFMAGLAAALFTTLALIHRTRSNSLPRTNKKSPVTLPIR